MAQLNHHFFFDWFKVWGMKRKFFNETDHIHDSWKIMNALCSFVFLAKTIASSMDDMWHNCTVVTTRRGFNVEILKCVYCFQLCFQSNCTEDWQHGNHSKDSLIIHNALGFALSEIPRWASYNHSKWKPFSPDKLNCQLLRWLLIMVLCFV